MAVSAAAERGCFCHDGMVAVLFSMRRVCLRGRARKVRDRGKADWKLGEKFMFGLRIIACGVNSEADPIPWTKLMTTYR